MLKIIKGHINEFTNKNQELVDLRLSICEECPLYIKATKQCNPFIYYNLETGEVTKKKMKYVKGWVRGCGCRLKAKTTLIDEHCPINKW